MRLKNFNGLLHSVWFVLLPIAGVVAVWGVVKYRKERGA